MRTIFETQNFKALAPDRPHVTSEDGGHIIIKPKVQKNNRLNLDADSAIELMWLTIVTGKAMCSVFPKCNCINYHDNGNWAFLRGDQPYFHVHLYGRSQESVNQPYFRSLYFPNPRKSKEKNRQFYKNNKPFTDNEIEKIRESILEQCSLEEFKRNIDTIEPENVNTDTEYDDERIIFRTKSFEAIVPKVSCIDREEGGHIVIRSINGINKRQELNSETALELIWLTMAVGTAMKDTIPACDHINYQNNENPTLLNVGNCKTLTVDIFGRSKKSHKQPFGQSLYFPDPMEYMDYYKAIKPFSKQDIENIKKALSKQTTLEEFKRGKQLISTKSERER